MTDTTEIKRLIDEIQGLLAADAKHVTDDAIEHTDRMARVIELLDALRPENGDEPALPVVSIADATVRAGDVARFLVTLSKPHDKPVVFYLYSVSDAFVFSPGGWQIGVGDTSLVAEVPTVSDVIPGAYQVHLLVDDEDATLGRSVATGTILAAEPPQEPDLTRGLLYSRDATSTEPIDPPPGKFKGARTVLSITKYANDPAPGVWEKDVGAASTQSRGQGAFAVGRTPAGECEGWIVAGGAFVQIKIPIQTRKASLVEFEIDEAAGQLRLAVDAMADARGFGLPIAEADIECGDGIGYWAGNRVNPRVGERRSIAVWDRVLSFEEKALWVSQRAHLIDAEPDPGPIDPPPPPPNGDPPPDLPPTGGRIVRVGNRAELQAAWSNAQAKDHIIMAPGNYGAVRLQHPKNGVRLEADGKVTWDGGYNLPHALDGIADDVSIVGELTLMRYGPQSGGLDSHNRLAGTTGETGVVLADRSWPNTSKRWQIRGLRVVDCPRREGVRLKGPGHEYRGGFIQGCSSVGLVFNNPVGCRAVDIEFRDINPARAASHHHSGAVKALGGSRDEISKADRDKGARWPATKDLQLIRCKGFNLINCRGLAWFDWDHDGHLIEDCLVDGVDKEGLALEASARIKIVRFTARRTNRSKHNNSPMWNAMVMFQNSMHCEATGCRFEFGGGHGLSVIGVQNWNRVIGGYIGQNALGQYNWVHDSQVIGNPPNLWGLGNGGPVMPDRPAPHPQAKKLQYCNWSGPGFG